MKRITLVAGALATLAWTAAPAWTPAPDGSPNPPERQSDPRADSLVGAWIDALGGMETYWQLQTARYTLTTEMYDAASGRLRRTRPRYVTIARTDLGEITRIERWEGDDFIVQGWDGTTAWATMNGDFLGPGDMDYDQVRYVSGDVQYWISLPFKLRDPGVNLHYRGVQDDGTHLVEVSFGEGVGLHDDSWRYWFEDGRTWPVRLAYREEGRTNWSVLSFEDIRTVDGYVVVGARVHVDGRGRVWKVLRTHDFELNPELDAGIFSRP